MVFEVVSQLCTKLHGVKPKKTTILIPTTEIKLTRYYVAYQLACLIIRRRGLEPDTERYVIFFTTNKHLVSED